MNEALRLLKRTLNRFGYDVRKIYDYDFMNVRNIDRLEESQNVEALKQALSSEKDAIDPGEISRLCISLMTYIPRDPNRAGREQSTDERDRGKPHIASGRITNASVHENVRVCLTSLVDSVNYAAERLGSDCIEIIIFDGHSNEYSVKMMKRLFEGVRCKWSFKTTKLSAMGPAMMEQFEFTRQKNCLIYFCNDDYLHLETAIYEMWEFYKNVFLTTGSHMIISPADHPDLYKHLYPSYIALGKNRHWRSIGHVTPTFLTHSMFVDKYWDYFVDFKYAGNLRTKHRASESKTVNKLFKHIPGFAPIPSLACHLQSARTIPPFFDWEELWNKYN